MLFVSRFAFVLMTAHWLCGSCAAIAQDEWTQFRGPEGQGHSAATGLPITWSETENVVWKTATPGEGHSSPVISGNQIWLTTAITKELTAEQEKERLAKNTLDADFMASPAVAGKALFLRSTTHLYRIENR